MKNDTCTLTNIEQKLCVHMAKSRQRMNREQGAVNKKKNKTMTPYRTELLGFAGEIAYCRILNIYPDLQYSSRRIEDAKLHDGRLVDVKTTRYDPRYTPSLMLEESKAPGACIYALVVANYPRFRYAGYATEAMLREVKVKEVKPGFIVHLLTEDKLLKD